MVVIVGFFMLAAPGFGAGTNLTGILFRATQ